MDSRERILERAEDLFRKKGFKSVTMDEIAKSLGMSKRTIYENFEDKDTLIESCLLKIITDDVERKEKVLESTPNIYEVMFEFAVIRHNETKDINPILFEDLHKYYASILENIKAKSQAKNRMLLEAIFNNGINNGYFFSKLNIEIACLMIEEYFDFSIKLMNERKLDHKEVIKTVYLSFFRGISTAKGIKAMEDIERRISNENI